jgi:alpha-beta hydrolase superfamily lysophospholipase
MSEIHKSLESFDGTTLFCRLTVPDSKKNNEQIPKGFILALHGLGDHSGRYCYLGEVTQNAGFVFAMCDLRGHGKSGNFTGDMESFSTVLLDILTLFSWLKKTLHTTYGVSIPCYGIFGHSFGGLLALYLANTLGPTCPKLFLSSPCLGIQQNVPLWKETLAKKLSFFMPRAKVPTGIYLKQLSHNPAVEQQCLADPLYQKELCLRSGKTVFDAIAPKRVRDLASHITTPLTVVVSEDDPIVSTKAIRKFLDLCPKEFLRKSHFVPGAFHEIFNESPEYADQAFLEYQHWLGD